MYNKVLFANEIMELDSSSRYTMTECEKFGTNHGCREECPILQRSECGLFSTVEEYLEECKGL